MRAHKLKSTYTYTCAHSRKRDEALGLITPSLMLSPINNYLNLKTQLSVPYNSLGTGDTSTLDNSKNKDCTNVSSFEQQQKARPQWVFSQYLVAVQCVFIASSHTPSDSPESHLPQEVGQERLAHEETEIHPGRLSNLSKATNVKVHPSQRIHNWYLWFSDNQNNSSQYRKRSEPILNRPQNIFNLSLSFPWTYS